MKFAYPGRPVDVPVKGVKEAHSEEGGPANTDSETLCKKSSGTILVGVTTVGVNDEAGRDIVK